MKNLLLVSSLFFKLFTAHAYERTSHGPMTAAEAEIMRVEAVTIIITDVNDRALSKKAKAIYEAFLKNPFTRGVVCTIEITSTQGNEIIETKYHPDIYAPARSAHKIKGEIEIKRGKKGEDDGLKWIEEKGNFVAARNCRFID